MSEYMSEYLLVESTVTWLVSTLWRREGQRKETGGGEGSREGRVKWWRWYGVEGRGSGGGGCGRGGHVQNYESWTRLQTGISGINFLFRCKYVRKRMYTLVDS